MKKSQVYQARRLSGASRWATIVAAMLLAALPSLAGIRVVSLKGDVTVRHGADTDWVTIAPGDALRPEDSIRMGEGSSATVTLSGAMGDAKTITLPPMVIVDIADLREMTRSDLLLKLAMEDVRSAPKSPAGGGDIPKTTTTRAGDRDTGPVKTTEPGSVNELRLNGAGVLYDHGFYGPCVLRSREILRIEPSLAGRVGPRLRMADALEKMQLGEEAYEVYGSLAGEKLSAGDKKLVDKKLQELKK